MEKPVEKRKSFFSVELCFAYAQKNVNEKILIAVRGRGVFHSFHSTTTATKIYIIFIF